MPPPPPHDLKYHSQTMVTAYGLTHSEQVEIGFFMVKKIKALFRAISMRYFVFKIQRNFIRHSASKNMSRICAYLTLPTSQMFEYLVRIKDKTRTHGRTKDRAG